MPPKRGKKGKRRGDSSSEDETANAAAAAVAASLKKATLGDNSDDVKKSGKGDPSSAAPAPPPAAGKRGKNKKKGKGRGNQNDSDSDDGDALDPLAHLKASGGRKGALRQGSDSDDEEDKPKKPLTKKEKRRLEEEQRRQEKKAAAGDSSEAGGDDGDEGRAGGGEEKAAVEDAKSTKGGKKGKKVHGKKGTGGDSDKEGEGQGQEEGGGDAPPAKKPPTKKEQRRLDEQERLRREAEAERVAAEAQRAQADGDGDCGGDGSHDRGERSTAVDLNQDDLSSVGRSSAAPSKKGTKGKKKGRKGRGNDDDNSDKEGGEAAEDDLSRGMKSLSVAGGGDEEGSSQAAAPPPAPPAKLSKKELRAAAAAAAAVAAAAAAEAAAAAAEAAEEDDDEEDEEEDDEEEEEEDDSAAAAAAAEAAAEREAAATAAAEAKAAAVAKAEAAAKLEKEEAIERAAAARAIEEQADSDGDGGQKKRMSKKERKKAKMQTRSKKEAAAEAEVVAPPPPPETAAAASAAGERSTSPLPQPPVSGVGAAERAAVGMDVEGADGNAAAAAAAAAAAPAAVEVVEGKKPKKEKKSKLMRKLEEAARMKAEAEAAAGVGKEEGGDGAGEGSAAAASVEEKKRKKKKEKKEAESEAKKEAKKAKEQKNSVVKSMLEQEYYGSDHEEREHAASGKAKRETVQEEVARLVAEAGGKSLTGRQRKKILQDVEARRRAADDEEKEELAHRDGAQFGCSQTAVSAGDQQWANSLDVTIEAFSISAHDKTLFKDSALQVVHGRKYGLVGPNGAGKSTLLKMIASGELKIPPRIDCLYVEQEVVADDTPAVIAVMKADKARWRLMEELRKLNRQLRDDPENEKLNDRLQEVHEEMHQSGGDGAEAQARRILFGLGFDELMQVKETKHFSGGWRMRISLARALFMEPTLLMLDEPTNHLDLNAVIWLDDYLQKWKKTLLVVSHDQDFLNSVCEEILHLDHQRVNQYKGNYDQFKEMEAQKRRQQAKEWEKQQRRLTALKKGGQSRGKAEETVKKSKFREPGGSKKKKNDAVAAGTGEVEKATLVERPRDYVVTLHFPEVSTLSPPVLQVMDVDFKYPTGPTILKNVNFGLDQSSRICIVGPNGAGKTTLLKLLTGALEPSTGYVRRNPRMRAGIYNQHFVDRLPMDIDPTSYLKSKFSDQCDYQQARNLLGRFGLEGHAHTIKMRDLSGGQKARVVFCELSLQAPHVLFLDEPTNNLDIESIDALCEAVTQFNGGVVVVTHDARLIEATECRLWIVDEQEVTPWQGEFDEYRADLLRKLEEKLAAQEQARIDANAAA